MLKNPRRYRFLDINPNQFQIDLRFRSNLLYILIHSNRPPPPAFDFVFIQKFAMNSSDFFS